MGEGGWFDQEGDFAGRIAFEGGDFLVDCGCGGGEEHFVGGGVEGGAGGRRGGEGTCGGDHGQRGNGGGVELHWLGGIGDVGRGNNDGLCCYDEFMAIVRKDRLDDASSLLESEKRDKKCSKNNAMNLNRIFHLRCFDRIRNVRRKVSCPSAS